MEKAIRVIKDVEQLLLCREQVHWLYFRLGVTQLRSVKYRGTEGDSCSCLLWKQNWGASNEISRGHAECKQTVITASVRRVVALLSQDSGMLKAQVVSKAAG